MDTPYPRENRQLCPICQKETELGRFAGPNDIEPAVVRYLQAANDWWTPEMGVCPDCLQNAIKSLLADSQSASQHKLATPIYGILPVGLRLGVDSRFNGQGITIAFLDSGFSAHPDLDGRIKLYVDASTNEIEEMPEVVLAGDLSWHGTMTSVVACGNGIMSGGLYRGLASQAEVLLIKVSNREGRVTEEGIGRGLAWVLANGRRFGIQIVNISLGGDNPPSAYGKNPVDLMVETLVATGIVVVCAAGNAGARFLVPPASAPAAITVGGLDDKNTLDQETYQLWHSNYGQTGGGVWKPELVAPSIWLAAPVLPGSGVAREGVVLERLLKAGPEELPALLEDPEITASTHLPEDIKTWPYERAREHFLNNWRNQKLITPYYQHVDGTSFAAPIISSVAARMLQANPRLNPPGLKDLLMRTATYLPEISPDQQGHGVVNPLAAVKAALATIPSQ